MSDSIPSVGLLDVFRVCGDVFMDGLVKILHWAHATKGIKPNLAQLRLAMPFDEVFRLVQEKRLVTRKGTGVVAVDISDIPNDVIALFGPI
jgi:hypothetical protein